MMVDFDMDDSTSEGGSGQAVGSVGGPPPYVPRPAMTD